YRPVNPSGLFPQALPATAILAEAIVGNCLARLSPTPRNSRRLPGVIVRDLASSAAAAARSLLLHHALHVAHHHLLHVVVFLVARRQFEQRGIGLAHLNVGERGRRGSSFIDGLILNREVLQVGGFPNERFGGLTVFGGERQLGFRAGVFLHGVIAHFGFVHFALGAA